MPEALSSGPARKQLSAIAIGALAATLAGCGTASSGSGSDSSSTSPAPSGAPAVLTRTGGVAGFSDEITVSPDGSVHVSTKAGRYSCHIDAGLAGELVSAAATLTASAPVTQSHPDDMSVTITGAEGSGPIDKALSSETLAKATDLVNESGSAPENRRVCR